MIDQTISHYRITGQLGSGGMGVVYEAEDLTLGRKVALKFLPPELSRDQIALDRFLLEARTASALNHPNICTIYAVEKAAREGSEEQFFIAMELLEGQNLAEKLSSGPLSLDRLLDVAMQLADALDAAHAKGIIHRDIKPANIFLTQRGPVKVLDFGLAKLTRPEMGMETIGATAESPSPAHLTSPGATVGTISYMSPEQARGEELDRRTDLFSLGAVLYQMATAQLPFQGATAAVVFHAILDVDPVPVMQWNAALPPKLQEIIDKLLEKDRHLRYQSAADLRGDLKRLKRDTESGRKAASASGSQPRVDPPPSAAQGATAPGALSSDVVRAVRKSKVGFGATAAILLGLLAAAGYGVYSFVTRSRPMPFQNISVTRVTDGGDAVHAAISPDGQYILGMMATGGQASLWLRNVPTNSNVQVQPPAEVNYRGLRFSPDGNHFYFVRSDVGNDQLRFLYRAPLLGGTPQKLAADVDTNVTFSPDGKNVAFMRFDNPDPGKYRLIVRPVEGSDNDERVLASGPNSEALYSPTWSPDGKTIAASQAGAGIGVTHLVVIDVGSGDKKILSTSSNQIFEAPEWMPDGSGVLGLLRGAGSNFNQAQIAFVSYPQGKLLPVTHDTNTYSDVSVARNGRVLATVMTEGRWNLEVLPASGLPAPPRRVAPVETYTNFTWTADGALMSDERGRLNRLDPASGAKTILATEEGVAAGNPAACADGRYVIFEMAFYHGGRDNNLWGIDASGANLKQLTKGTNDIHPVCSGDGKWVYYLERGNEDTLYRSSIDGGTPQSVSSIPITAIQFDISPDGKLAAFATLDHTLGHKIMLVLVANDTGEAKRLEFQRDPFGFDSLRFSPDGKGVVYPTRSNGVDNLWLQPLDGSRGRQLTNFTTEHIFDFHWSFDGKQLALVRGHTDSDVVLIRNQQ